MAYKYNMDSDAYNRVINNFSSSNNRSKSSNRSTSSSSNDFMNQFNYYKSSYSKQLEEQEERKRQREEEERKKKEQEEYYNSNKDTLIKQRTNSLIYNWDLDASGGQKYNYNNSKDTNTSDFYTNLGIQDLAINDFLLADEEAENKKKSKMWQDKENAKERFKNLSPLENKTTEASNIFNSITEQKTKTSTINPYENKDSYYKQYIEKFNTSIKNGNIKAANNALEKINSKYFGADYSDGIFGTLFGDAKDADVLYNRFDTNVKKLEAINNSIANGADDATLNKLKAEKSRLEFENQLIQYNKLTVRYSTDDTFNMIDNIYKKVEDPFKNASFNELKWDKDKNAVENITNNFANLTNRAVQMAGATANAVMELSFGSLTSFLTNDIESDKAREFAAGIIDFAEYLVPYVGQYKLYIDTAASGSVALPGLYNNLLAKKVGLEEQQSAILGENPNELQTLGASLYVAMNFVLDALIKKSPLGKFSFDDKTSYEISKMTFGEIAKTLGITSVGEGAEEFFQAYGEDMMYGDKDRTLKDIVFDKELRAQAFKNFIYAVIVSGAVGTTQVGKSKLKYKNTNITTNTKYAHINKTPEGAINVDSTSVEKVDSEKLTETLTNALQENNSVDIISTDIDNTSADLDIEYGDTTTTDTTTTDTTEESLLVTNENTNTIKSNAEAITFDSTEKTILETMNNPTYYEARGLSENPTLQDIYELLVNNNDPMADKLFYYNELYGNKKYSTFLTNLNNGKITPELVAQQVLPENNKTNYSPNDIKNNTVTTVVPSQEMANYILTNNPNADVEVIDVKSPTFNEDVKNYVNGKATYNLNLNKKIQNEKSPTTVDSKTIKNLNTELSDLNKTLSKVEAKEDTPISKVKVDNSALASGNFVDISNNVQENLLNTLDTENHSLEERRDHLKETLAILQKYNNETRTSIKQKGGKPVVFDKTGFNTYEATDTISTEDSTPAIVNSTGKFIYGNSEARLNLSERAVNKINLMIDKLQLNGDKLTTRSTHKDVADLINKNKDMSKEILQILGYDGVLTGKQKTKLITATDNNDSVDIDKAFDETTKKVDEIIAAEKEGSSKESFIAMMQIARETLQGETKTKPVKTGSKQIDSTKSSTRVKSDLNLDNKTITETKLDATQSDIKNSNIDNLGNKLTAKDKKFIENSKVTDENGLPKMVYRGSNADKILSNTTNSKEKISFFSDDADIADSYRNSIDGKQYSSYINIETPYIIDANGAMFNKIKSDIGNTTDEIVNAVLKLNNESDTKYDGIIFNNVLDRGPYYHKKLGNKLSTVYVTFNSNQINIKNTDINTKSKKIEKPTPIKSEVKVKAGDIEIKGNPETISVDTLQDIEEAFNEVSVHSKKSTKNLKNAYAKVYSAVFDRYSPILKIANEKSNLDVKNAISDLWTIRNKVHNNVKVEQTDINGNVVGKSLDSIKKQIKKQDLNDFQKAARAILNVERIKNGQDQVLNLDAKKSQQYYDYMIKKHPYFKNVFNDLKVWNTNNTQKLYDAGLINIKQKQALDNSYKIYVPIYSAEPSDFNDIGEKSYNTKLKANDTLKPTTKQGKSILDIWTAFVVQEQNLENSILKNNAYKAMADSKLYSIDTKGKNTGTDIIYYDNGKINKFTTSDDIANVFEKQSIEKTLDNIFSMPVLNWFPKLKTKVQQKMLTSYDPIYTANNMLRDFGDSALFYSKYPLKFAKNYIRAAYNAANNSVLYQEIANTGIIPKTASTNKFTRILTSIESLPKMSEYLSAIESGKTPTEAKLEAQDVNLNFARGGYATQALNSKGWLFLNASTQALDKTASTIKYDIGKIKTNPLEGSLNLLLKVGAMSAPAMLNALMNQDDDDYEKLPYYYKNNYYMIKLEDNKFLRIPKGRIVGTVDTLVRYASGIDEEIDLKTYLKSIKSSLESSILPADLIESSPFSEISAVTNNKNYYGAEIYDEDASLDKQVFDVINYISSNIFGRYGKAFKNLMDGDNTTDIWDINSYVFDSTKYDKNLSDFYTLKNKYTGLSKDADFNDRIYKKYIDSKYSAINSISHDIKEQKANGATLDDMKDLYQMRDALTKDTLDNYDKYTIDKSGDKWIIYFDDITFTYNPEKDEFRKLKN